MRIFCSPSRISILCSKFDGQCSCYRNKGRNLNRLGIQCLHIYEVSLAQPLFEKVFSFVVYHNKSGKIFYINLPDSFHTWDTKGCVKEKWVSTLKLWTEERIFHVWAFHGRKNGLIQPSIQPHLPSSSLSSTSTLRMQFLARIAAGPPILPK
jgi:hypothetical protein